MGILDYRRHFGLLGVAAVVLFVLTSVHVAMPFDRAHFLFGSSGALHALAVVLSLRPPASWWSRLAFVAAAAALSVAALFGGIAVADLVGLRGFASFYVALAATAAIGAVLYRFLVRVFWARFLAPRDLLLTAGACVAATFGAAVLNTVVPRLRDVLMPLFWWCAFSACLWWADRPQRGAGPRKPTVGPDG